MRPLDVGGEGDCFFRAISHQLYGDSNHHLDIRIAGVNYLRENPERFIESNIESSWMQYLANMSTPGTWCDNLVIQAVADILNLKIHIIESDENFALFNIIEPLAPQHQPTVVHIGHLGEYHYVSTISLQLGSAVSNVGKSNDKQKQKRKIYLKEYMKEYMKKKRSTETSQEKGKKNWQHKEYMKKKRSSETFQNKQNQQNKEYMKKRRLSETSQEKEKKNWQHKEYMKKKRTSETFQNKQNQQNKCLQSLILKFHDIVSKGPLYVCSCCDQLWYKHSVLSAATLRKKNHDAKKYLQNKTSVNNVEWLCKTCLNYLAKNTISYEASIF